MKIRNIVKLVEKDALKGHLELMKEDEMEIPEPTTRAASIEVTV